MVWFEFRATGMSHYERNIKEIGERNPEYGRISKAQIEEAVNGDRIFKYDFDNATDVKLVPEPENPYDPNAIAVYVEDLLVGYVKKPETKIVRKLLESEDFAYIDLDMGGGPYKEIDTYEETADDGFISFYVHFTIYMKWEDSQVPEEYWKYQANRRTEPASEVRITEAPKIEPTKPGKPKKRRRRFLRYTFLVLGALCVLSAITNTSAGPLVTGAVLIFIGTRIGRKPKEEKTDETSR